MFQHYIVATCLGNLYWAARPLATRTRENARSYLSPLQFSVGFPSTKLTPTNFKKYINRVYKTFCYIYGGLWGSVLGVSDFSWRYDLALTAHAAVHSLDLPGWTCIKMIQSSIWRTSAFNPARPSSETFCCPACRTKRWENHLPPAASLPVLMFGCWTDVNGSLTENHDFTCEKFMFEVSGCFGPNLHFSFLSFNGWNQKRGRGGNFWCEAGLTARCHLELFHTGPHLSPFCSQHLMANTGLGVKIAWNHWSLIIIPQFAGPRPPQRWTLGIGCNRIIPTRQSSKGSSTALPTAGQRPLCPRWSQWSPMQRLMNCTLDFTSSPTRWMPNMDASKHAIILSWYRNFSVHSIFIITFSISIGIVYTLLYFQQPCKQLFRHLSLATYGDPALPLQEHPVPEPWRVPGAFESQVWPGPQQGGSRLLAQVCGWLYKRPHCPEHRCHGRFGGSSAVFWLSVCCTQPGLAVCLFLLPRTFPMKTWTRMTWSHCSWAWDFSRPRIITTTPPWSTTSKLCVAQPDLSGGCSDISWSF